MDNLLSSKASEYPLRLAIKDSESYDSCEYARRLRNDATSLLKYRKFIFRNKNARIHREKWFCASLVIKNVEKILQVRTSPESARPSESCKGFKFSEISKQASREP